MFLPSEKTIFRIHPHWLCILLLEVGLVGYFLLSLVFIDLFIPGDYFSWFSLFFLLVIVFVMIVLFLDWFTTRYYLTNYRLIKERGIIGKTIVSIWLDRIQDVTCSFGLFGSFFAYGDLEIESAGTFGKMILDSVPRPRKLLECIEEAILDYEKEYEENA